MSKNYPKNKLSIIIAYFVNYSMLLFIYMFIMSISLYIVLPAIKSNYKDILEYIFIFGGGITSYRIYDKMKV